MSPSPLCWDFWLAGSWADLTPADTAALGSYMDQLLRLENTIWHLYSTASSSNDFPAAPLPVSLHGHGRSGMIQIICSRQWAQEVFLILLGIPRSSRFPSLHCKYSWVILLLTEWKWIWNYSVLSLDSPWHYGTLTELDKDWEQNR